VCELHLTPHFIQGVLLVSICVTYTQLRMLTFPSAWHRMKRVLCQRLTSSSRTHGMLRDPCPRPRHRAPPTNPLPAGKATNQCMGMVPLSSLQSICSTGSSTNSSACCTTSSSSSNTTTSNRSSMLLGTSSVATNSLCLHLQLCPLMPSTTCSSCNSSQASVSGLP